MKRRPRCVYMMRRGKQIMVFAAKLMKRRRKSSPVSLQFHTSLKYFHSIGSKLMDGVK